MPGTDAEKKYENEYEDKRNNRAADFEKDRKIIVKKAQTVDKSLNFIKNL